MDVVSRDNLEGVNIRQSKQNTPLAWLVTFVEVLAVGIYLYVRTFYYLDRWGGKFPISPETQIGWEFTYGLQDITLPDVKHRINMISSGLIRHFKTRFLPPCRYKNSN